jgi:diguanylate cyclase (GGDEF)-like protein
VLGVPRPADEATEPQRLSEQQAWVSAQAQATLIYRDLCDFVSVNARLGHADGDRVLFEIAQRFGRIDEWVARLESDAFALLIPGTTDEAEHMARQLLATLETPVEIHQSSVAVKARVGLASTTVCGANILELLRGGVMALTAASSLQYAPLRQFSRGLSTTTADGLDLLRDLKDAISADQFEIYLQPIIQLRSARIVKFEVLLRWFHATRGAVSPTLFIEIAERFSVISLLDRFVIGKVLHSPTVFGCVMGLPLFCGLGQSQAARLFSNSAGLRKFRLECNRCLL